MTFGVKELICSSFMQMTVVLIGLFPVRYHRCQGDPDGHVFTHRLLTEGFREDEVNPVIAVEGSLNIAWMFVNCLYC